MANGVAHSWAALKALSDDELITEHDAVAKRTLIGTQHYIDELRFREQHRTGRRMEALSRRVFCLTIFVTALTVVNVALSMWAQFFR